MQYPEGVDFGEEKAYLVIGIAGVGDEHLEVLGKLRQVWKMQIFLKA
jgi:PTS system mannitol-specific IIC component